MALSNNRRQRTFTLCALYLAQGIPWGFMTITLVAYLTSQGVSVREAGELAAIVLVPWTFKLIWAPLIDSITIPSMGRRRAWIIGAELMMAVTLLGLLYKGDHLLENLNLLKWMFFVHNCFASLQDVATDALALDVLPKEEQGRVNGLMWGSKLMGKGLGAALLAQVMFNWGFSAAVLVQFFLLLVIMLIPIFIVERPGDKRFPWSSTTQPESSQPKSSVRNPLHVLRDLITCFSLSTAAAFAVFAVVKLIGSGVNEIVAKALYMQELGWNYVEYSGASGWAIIPELIGAVGGGFLADRFGRRKIMTVGFALFALLSITFAANPEMWEQRWFATGYLLLYPGFLAIGSVGFLSMAMKISWSKAAATMFTTYMTLSNIGHVLGNEISGSVREFCSYEQTFWAVGIASLLPIALLLIVRPDQIDLARNAELSANDDDSDTPSDDAVSGHK